MTSSGPLAHLEAACAAGEVTGARGVSLRELPFAVMASVRADPTSVAAYRIGDALGAALPTECGRTAQVGRTTALWLGPNEWLAVSFGDREDLVAELTAGVGDEHASVVDVSANRTTLELAGPSARDTLEKGCGLDLHPRLLQAGTAVTTQVGPVPVILWKIDEVTYRLLLRASFADYLTRWLLDAMREHAAASVP